MKPNPKGSRLMEDDVRIFIKDVTLFIQSHRSKSEEQMDDMFQRAYRLYAKYDVENTRPAPSKQALDVELLTKALMTTQVSACMHKVLNAEGTYLYTYDEAVVKLVTAIIQEAQKLSSQHFSAPKQALDVNEIERFLINKFGLLYSSTLPNDEILNLPIAKAIFKHFSGTRGLMTVEEIEKLLEDKFRMVYGITVLEGDENEHYVDFTDLAQAIRDAQEKAGS